MSKHKLKSETSDAKNDTVTTTKSLKNNKRRQRSDREEPIKDGKPLRERFQIRKHEASNTIREFSAKPEEESKLELSKNAADYEEIYEELSKFIEETNMSAEADAFRWLLRGNAKGLVNAKKMKDSKRIFTEYITNLCTNNERSKGVMIGKELTKLGYKGLSKRLGADFMLFARKLFKGYPRKIGDNNAKNYFNGAEVVNTCRELRRLEFKKLDLVFSYRQLVVGMNSNLKAINDSSRRSNNDDRIKCIRQFSTKAKSYDNESWYEYITSKRDVKKTLDDAASYFTEEMKGNDFGFEEVMEM
jgi:hypothetical protein